MDSAGILITGKDMNNKERIKQGVSYIFFGVLTSLVNFTVFYIFKKSGLTADSFGYTFANAVSWTAAVTFAFFTNKSFVFGSKSWEKKKLLSEAAKFVAGRIFSGAFEILLPTPLAMVFKAGITVNLGDGRYFLDGQWIAKILVAVLVVILNYIISKFFVFGSGTNSDKNSFGDNENRQ